MAEFQNHPAFQTCINEHNQNLSLLWSWRLSFVNLADPLSKQIVAWAASHSNVLKESVLKSDSTVKTCITDWNKHAPTTAYDPWAGWWAGRWNNKYFNLHLWDDTKSGLQPVSQLEAKKKPGVWFAHKDNIDALQKQGEVDIALNAVKSRDGLTGWVRKQQNSSESLPHIAFKLSSTCLVWIARIYDLGGPFDPFVAPKGYQPSKFFCFIEQTNSTRSTMYVITGFEFWIDFDRKKDFAFKAVKGLGAVKHLVRGRLILDESPKDHYGRYRRVTPYRTRADMAKDPAAKSGVMKDVLDNTRP